MNNTVITPKIMANDKCDEWLKEAAAWISFYRAIVNDDEKAAQQAFENNNFTNVSSDQLHNENMEWVRNVSAGRYVMDEYPETEPYFEELLIKSVISSEEIYRQVKAKHVKEDALNEAEELDIDITDEQAEIIAQKYVYEGIYDCNKSYWSNLDYLIREIKYYE